MNRLAPMMSSERGDWRTPANVLDLVRAVGRIALDPCGHQDSLVGAAVELRRARGEDGLTADWAALAKGGLVFVNSPYGRQIGDWVGKCHAEFFERTAEVIALLPARPDTAWWHDHCAPGLVASTGSEAVCFLRGRLTFVGAPAPAPFPSALAYWGHRSDRFAEVFAPHGSLWLPSR